MPKIILNANEARKGGGQSGFGAQIYVRKLESDFAATDPTMLGLKLGGLRDVRNPNGVTNPIPVPHHESENGAIDFIPGLRDEGVIDFDAYFLPDEREWQRQASDFMQSFKGTHVIQNPVFGDDTPMLQGAFVLGKASVSMINFRGFMSMNGPYAVGSIEGAMQASYQLKCSGVVYQTYPQHIFTNLGSQTITAGPSVTEDAFELDAVTETQLPDGNYVFRVVLPKRYELWSKPVTVDDTFRQGHTVAATNFGTAESAAFNAVIQGVKSGTTLKYSVLAYEYPWPL